MYERLPDSDEPDAFGLCAKDYAHEVVECWPENWRAYDLFRWAATQWRVGAAGPTGLDYTPLLHKMDRLRLELDDYEQLESDVRAMEYEALRVMAERE